MLRKSSALIAASVIFVSLASSVRANDKNYGPEIGSNWLDHVATSSDGSPVNSIKGYFLGSAASATKVDREVETRLGARHLNVRRGETVLIKVGGKAFAWKFDTVGTPVFDLAEIAPKDLNIQGVRVYVARSPYDNDV